MIIRPNLNLFLSFIRMVESLNRSWVGFGTEKDLGCATGEYQTEQESGVWPYVIAVVVAKRVIGSAN